MRAKKRIGDTRLNYSDHTWGGGIFNLFMLELMHDHKRGAILTAPFLPDNSFSLAAQRST